MKKISLAIAEDSPELASSLQSKFSCFEEIDLVFIASNGLEMIEKIEKQLVDVILMDINMPIMDGWQFLDEFIRIKTKKTINVYIVSSSVNPSDIERAKTYNMVSNYIVKPISREKLYSITEEVFSKL